MSSDLARRLAVDLDNAFPELLDRYGAMVLSLAVRMTDVETGRDLTQEAFLRAYRALVDYELAQVCELRLRPWLASITRNLARNEYRRVARRPARPTDSVELSRLADSHDGSIDGVAARIDAQADLTAGMAGLSEAQQEVVLLRYVAQLSVADVAEITGLPPNTVKSHAARGLSHLRAAIGPERPTEDRSTNLRPTEEGVAR